MQYAFLTEEWEPLGSKKETIWRTALQRYFGPVSENSLVDLTDHLSRGMISGGPAPPSGL